MTRLPSIGIGADSSAGISEKLAEFEFATEDGSVEVKGLLARSR